MKYEFVMARLTGGQLGMPNLTGEARKAEEAVDTSVVDGEIDG